MALLVFYDTETTGLDPELGDDIVQLGSRLYRLGDKDALDYMEFANPGRPISESASRVHGIYAHHVAEKPSAGEVIKEWFGHVMDEPGPRFLVGHNILNYDNRFLRKYVDLSQFDGMIDTLILARRLLPTADSHKLSDLYHQLTGKQGKAHDAMGDVLMLFDLLLWALDSTGMTPKGVVDWLSQPVELDKMPFGKHKGRNFSDIPAAYMEFMLSKPDMDADVVHSMRLALREIA
jgi:DNA polymerase III epsilon subunit-like protein